MNVNYLVEASAVHAANRVRINVRLIEAATERTLWSKSYQRDMGDILTLQDEVAQAVAMEVSVKLSPQEEAQFAGRRPVNPEAFDAYEMGQFHYNKRTAEGYRASVRYYEQAIERDPDYALAYAGLALTYCLRTYSVGRDLPTEEAISRARSAAEKALKLDAMQAQAHAALALIRYKYDYDWAGAEQEFRRAVELNPNYSDGYLWYADYLATMGRNGEAQERLRSANLLDPMSPNITMQCALALAREGQFDQAIRMHRKSIELSGPGQWNTYFWMSSTYKQMGRYSEAIAVIQKALEISGGALIPRTSLGHVYALSGKRIEAEKILNDLEKVGDPFNLAYLCTGLGRKDEAINWLEKLYEGNRTGLFLLKTMWEWDPLRSDPRFQDLLRRLGLPPDQIKH